MDPYAWSWNAEGVVVLGLTAAYLVALRGYPASRWRIVCFLGAMAMLLALGLCTLPGALPASAAPNVSSVLATTDTADPAILSSRPAPHTEIIIVRSTPATAAAPPRESRDPLAATCLE